MGRRQPMINALARLGWSLDDQTEFMSRETIIANFTLDRVVKAPAGFDPDKLLSYQAHWMNLLPGEEKRAGCLPFLIQAGLSPEDPEPTQREFLDRVIAGIGERLVVFADILRYDEFFRPDDEMAYDEKAFDKRIRQPAEALPLLEKLRDTLQATPVQTTSQYDALVHLFVEEQGINIGQLIHALRVALTGKPAGVGLFEAMSLLGNERCIARIERAIAHAEKSDSPGE